MTLASSTAPDRSSDPIGVFDSGVGGLSVLRALRAELPLERFVYVADSGHAPYGERDDTHLIQRSYAIARFLVRQHHIKSLVVACNTATAAAIKQLRQDFLDLPIVGIEPALKPAAKHSHTHHIGVLATRSTLNSEKFHLLLQSLKDQASFVIQPCDGLADAIERDDAAKIIAACTQYTRAMGRFGLQNGDIDTLVLGCTHYPFAHSVLRDLVGEHIALFDGGVPVARQTRKLLTDRDWLTANVNTPQSDLLFYSTGNRNNLESAVERWLGWLPAVQTLENI
jgi:glutamate racemase